MRETLPFFQKKKKKKQADGKVPDLVIGSDTVVVLDNEILEKPRDQAHAVQMLTKLSGRQHDVFTGCLYFSFIFALVDVNSDPAFPSVAPRRVLKGAKAEWRYTLGLFASLTEI